MTPLERAIQDGREHLAVGEGAAAEARFRAALGQSPGNLDALAGLARSQLAQGEVEQSLVSYAELTALGIASPAEGHCEALRRGGDLALSQGNIDLAEDRVRALEAVHCPPREAPLAGRVLWQRAEQQRAARQNTQALQTLRDLLALEPGRVDASLAAARLALRARDRDGAVEILGHALDLAPEDSQLKALMVEALGIRYPDRP